jgi:hypothetical protein
VGATTPNVVDCAASEESKAYTTQQIGTVAHQVEPRSSIRRPEELAWTAWPVRRFGPRTVSIQRGWVVDKANERGADVLDALLEYEVPEDFTKFPVVDGGAAIPKDPERVDRRQEPGDPGVDLPDYSGPFRSDLRFTDFSKEMLLNMIEMNLEYMRVWVGAWLEEAEERFGRDERLELEWLAWRDGMAPKLEGMLREFLPPAYAEERLAAADLGSFVGERPTDGELGIDYDGPFGADPSMLELTKEELVSILLGSHEFILQCNQGVSMHIVMRHGFEDMFAIAWDIWSAKVLPAVKGLKERRMGIDGNDVAAFMKDLQIDSSAMPGKAFDLTFEMPEPDVGIMTFNRCPAPEMFEALGREDILEQNCHAVCPASIEETAKLYNPNMKMDILAIPPRVDSDHVCCRWKLSMRDEDDPEYVPVELSPRRPAR